MSLENAWKNSALRAKGKLSDSAWVMIKILLRSPSPKIPDLSFRPFGVDFKFWTCLVARFRPLVIAHSSPSSFDLILSPLCLQLLQLLVWKCDLCSRQPAVCSFLISDFYLESDGDKVFLEPGVLSQAPAPLLLSSSLKAENYGPWSLRLQLSPCFS